jgi:thioester reductase-like protein
MRDGSRERLMKYLEWYFGKNEAERLIPRIEVIKGNIEDEYLGLEKADYEAYAEAIDEIYHSAADVRHYSPDEEAYMRTNVSGTEHMLRFARQADASFYHISTCSVSGETFKDSSRRSAVFTEDDYDIGQVWENNIYVKSKFLAEGLVFMAKEEGLRVKIFRLGRLVGRASDGKFQINPTTNAFYLFMKGFSQIGALPEDAADVKLDIMPIDVCAKEVLALKDGEDTVYHIMNSDPPGFGEILRATDKECLIVDNVEFGNIFREHCREMNRELLGLVMDNWHIMGSKKQGIEVSCKKTAEALARAGFVCPELRLDTVLKEFGKGE